MANLVLSVFGDTIKETADTLFGYPALTKIIRGILDNKTAMDIIESLRPADVSSEEWGRSALASDLQRLLLKIGVQYPTQTRLLEDRWSLAKSVYRTRCTEIIEVIGLGTEWKLLVTTITDDGIVKSSEVTEERIYDNYASAVDDWLWATR